MSFLSSLFGQSEQSGPTPLGMFADQDSFLGRFEGRMNNPYVAAALGAGGALLGNQGSLGEGIQSGLLGGAGSALGSMRAQRQRAEDEERNKLMKRLLRRYGDVADRQATPQSAPAPSGPVFEPFGAIPGIQGGGAFAQPAPPSPYPMGGLY